MMLLALYQGDDSPCPPVRLRRQRLFTRRRSPEGPMRSPGGAVQNDARAATRATVAIPADKGDRYDPRIDVIIITSV